MTTQRWSAEFVDDTRRGTWAITDDQVWDDRYVLLGLTKEQAEFGVMMLSNEGIGNTEDFRELQYELSEALEPVTCKVCEKHFMRAQMHDDRCPADQT